ncbi:DUF3953 domain-containing protein [Clostridium chromiireducens]|uniref:DUF3953 domain-containing protein n=1 Tax=Clostridium chromiireducens TaxID=225345 RepID=A0A399IUM4_9CLOT|nr:DUF3953 domain-containing protein [Clostridium chromiireducens]
MYYNSKIKIINISLTIIVLLTVIVSITTDSYKIYSPIMFIFLGAQNLLMAFNYFKLHKKNSAILSISVGIFLVLVSIKPF